MPKKCCGAFIEKSGLSVPDYIVTDVGDTEKTAVVQFRRPYIMQTSTGQRRFRTSTQVRLPYVIILDLLREDVVPIFLVNSVEKETFNKEYGITE